MILYANKVLKVGEFSTFMWKYSKESLQKIFKKMFCDLPAKYL